MGSMSFPNSVLHVLVVVLGILLRPCLFSSLFRLHGFLGLCLLVQLDDGLTGIVGEAIVGITTQKLLKSRPRRFGVVQIVLVNFADGEQAIKTILAAGILAAQELVLLDS